MSPELEAFDQRMKELEKQVAHLAALLTEQSDPDRAIEARSFIVRDELGQRRAELGLVTFEREVTPHPSPWFGLFDVEGTLRACVGVGGVGRGGPIEGPWLEMYNEKGKTGVEIGFDDDNPKIRLFNEDGRPTVGVANSEFGACIALFNADGKARLSVNTSLSGDPYLYMHDANGDVVLKLSVEGGSPHLVFARDNQVFWSAP